MSLLATTWLFIESFVIPHGFLMFFYLSFYIHPVFLVFCQVFLWLNQLIKLLFLLFHPLILVFNLTLILFGSIKRVVVYLFSCIRPTKSDVFYDALEPDVADSAVVESAVVVSCKTSHFVVNDGVDESIEEINHSRSCVRDSWLNNYLYSDHYTDSLLIYNVKSSHDHCINNDHDHSIPNCGTPRRIASWIAGWPPTPDREDDHLTFGFDHLPALQVSVSRPRSRSNSVSGYYDHDQYVHADAPDPQLLSDSPKDMILDEGCDLPLTQQSVIVDQFQQTYESRMKFFNILYQERLQGINAISNELLSLSPTLFDCIEATDCPVQTKTWSKVAKKRLMRILECDLDMICVAQCCLLWEALDHQFHKVESFVGGKILFLLFKDNICGRFQEIQIKLERFVEDERCEGHGSSSRNSTSKRLSFQGFLQVPDVTGFVAMEEENQMMSQEYCTRPGQLLEAIDKCIKAFWSYIKTEDKKSFWKCKEFWRTRPHVEDPQDLELLYHVVKLLDKKWLTLRGVQGKSKCWVRRKVKPVEAEDEKRNIMFSMIDLNLVQRLLKMSLISKSHLLWCQQRLENLDIVQDRVLRGHIIHLFPS